MLSKSCLAGSLTIVMAAVLLYGAVAPKASADGMEASSTTSSTYQISFGSVKSGQQQYDVLVKQHIFDGETGAHFEESTNRAQFAKIVATLWELPEDRDSAAAFLDLDGCGWAKGYIGAAAKAGLLQGVADDRFDPGAPVSHEQMAVVMSRAFKLQPAPVEKGTYIEALLQSKRISDWARSGVTAALQNGVTGANADYTRAATRGDLIHTAYAAYARKVDLRAQSCRQDLQNSPQAPYDRCTIQVGDVFGDMKVTAVKYYADVDSTYGYEIYFASEQPVTVSGRFTIVPGDEVDSPEHIVFEVDDKDAGKLPAHTLKWGSTVLKNRFKDYGNGARSGRATIQIKSYSDLNLAKGGVPDSTSDVTIVTN